MIKFFLKIFLIIALVYLFGGQAFFIAGKVFKWISSFFFWLANWLKAVGFDPIFKIF